MIGALAILVMAMLFVVFGLLHLGEGKGCGSGHCDSCSSDCELGSPSEFSEARGRLP